MKRSKKHDFIGFKCSPARNMSSVCAFNPGRFVLRLGNFTGALRDLRCGEFVRALKGLGFRAFTLVEMLMALLIVSVILSASLPVISMRVKSQAVGYSKYSSVPIGMIAMWKVDGGMPDATWLEANGQVIPNGIEYEECRRIYGSRLPDLRGADNEFYDSLNSYLSKDIKEYLQSAIKPLPKDGIIIWGLTANIPEGWSEATEYRGVFLRGYGQTPAVVQSWVDSEGTTRNAITTYNSGNIGEFQGDTTRELYGYFNGFVFSSWNTLSTGVFHTLREVPRASLGVNSPGYLHLLDSAATYFNTSRSTPTSNEIRPINKAVRYIKYSNSSAMPDMPEPPPYKQKFRYIVKVRN